MQNRKRDNSGKSLICGRWFDSPFADTPTRLRDGRSIRTVSALLLQLVQTSAHDVPSRARKIMKTRLQAQSTQETAPIYSVGFSDDDVEVTRDL